MTTCAALTRRVKSETKTCLITSGEDPEGTDKAIQTDGPAGTGWGWGGHAAAVNPRQRLARVSVKGQLGTF